MRGLLALPVETLILIAEHLPLHAAQNLALVNRKVFHSAQYRLLRDIRIDFRVVDFEPQRRWLQAIKKQKGLPAVRTITVLQPQFDYTKGKYRTRKGGETAQVELRERASALCFALSAMPGCHLLDWQGNKIPRPVLHHLVSLPHIRLAAQTHHHDERELRTVVLHPDGLPHSLKRNMNLHALDVDLEYPDEESCQDYMRHLKPVLLSCPNLRKLRLNVRMPQDGCEVYTVPEDYHGLAFRDDEKLPALEELDLVAYPFGARPGGWESRNIYGYPHLSECVFWADQFDWSRLERLKIGSGAFKNRISFAKRLLPHLTALREVTLAEDSCYKDCSYHEFLTDVPAHLEVVSFTLDNSLGIGCLARHSSTLRKLTMHGMESYHDDVYNSYRCLLWLQMRELRTTLPDLEELELDLVRTEGGEWPLSDLEVLASFSRLKKLTLWFALPISALDRVSPDKPFLTFSSATLLFGHLRSQGSRIEELVVHSGAPPPMQAGDDEGPDWAEDNAGAFWAGDNATTFRCTVAERDWDAARDMVTTTCENVDDEANEWMRAQERQASSLEEWKRKLDFTGFCEVSGWVAVSRQAERVFRVAWEGPMMDDEWMSYH